MNTTAEDAFARRIALALDQGASTLDKPVADKLYALRNEALRRQRIPAEGWYLAGVGGLLGQHRQEQLRSALLLGAFVLGMGSVYFWGGLSREPALPAVEAELLAEELPIDAYLDDGFKLWVDTANNTAP